MGSGRPWQPRGPIDLDPGQSRGNAPEAPGVSGPMQVPRLDLFPGAGHEVPPHEQPLLKGRAPEQYDATLPVGAEAELVSTGTEIREVSRGGDGALDQDRAVHDPQGVFERKLQRNRRGAAQEVEID